MNKNNKNISLISPCHGFEMFSVHLFEYCKTSSSSSSSSSSSTLGGFPRNKIIDMEDVKAISKNFGHLDVSMDGSWADFTWPGMATFTGSHSSQGIFFVVWCGSLSSNAMSSNPGSLIWRIPLKKWLKQTKKNSHPSIRDETHGWWIRGIPYTF